MKTWIRSSFLLLPVVAISGLMPADRVQAQTKTNLHSFTRGSDGAGPRGTLILSGNTLYGTASAGGDWDKGTVFAVNTDGTGFTNLYSFTATSDPSYTNSDGAYPHAGLILDGNTLYGTTTVGGTFGYGNGTVFKINTDGSGFKVLHIFADYPEDGANCYARLVLSGNTLYGTTLDGGSSRRGTVFAVNTDGNDYRLVHSFSALSSGANNDGAHPYAGLVLSGNTLYGTAYYGGSSGNGTVFAVNTDGSGFNTLHSFTAMSASLTNSDGAYPHGELILSGNTLYGTAYFGGASSNGTVFAVKTDGTGFTTLHNFEATIDFDRPINGEGARPFAELTLAGNTLFGMALRGGGLGWGTMFAINTDGSGYSLLHTFAGPYTGPDGGYPESGLILSGNTLYGTAVVGGSSFWGAVFRFRLPELTITRFGANVILTWPTNSAGFSLQSSTNLISSTVWITNSPPPFIVNGQNTVINSITGAQRFYRLGR